MQIGGMCVCLLAVDLPGKELRCLPGNTQGPRSASLHIAETSHPHFKDEEMETQKGDVVCSKVLNQ